MTQISRFPGTECAPTWAGTVLARANEVLTSTKRHATKTLAAIALVAMTAGAQAQTEQKPEDIATQAYIYGLQQAIFMANAGFTPRMTPRKT